LNGFYKEGCYEWTKNKIIKTMTDYNVEIYCEDMLDATVFQWYHNDILDDENRVGITECMFVSAHYRLWDDIIDFTLDHSNCGFINLFSGAGRNDLQSLRRAVPMFRSDNDYTSIAQRLSITSSLTEWLPFSGSGIQEKENRTDAKGMLDTYTWRASYLPIINIDTQFAQDPDQDFSILINGMAEWKRVNPYLLKDFYSLTPWHSGEDKSGFTSYCYYDEDEGRGVLFVFRGEECEGDGVGLRLPFADRNASYALTDEDSGDLLTLTGNTAADGFGISVESKRQAKLIWIEKRTR
jgi:alpha-galactosidase